MADSDYESGDIRAIGVDDTVDNAVVDEYLSASQANSGDGVKFEYYSTAYLDENKYHSLEPNVETRHLLERSKAEIVHCISEILAKTGKSTLYDITLSDIFWQYFYRLISCLQTLTQSAGVAKTIHELCCWLHVSIIHMQQACSMQTLMTCRSVKGSFREYVGWPDRTYLGKEHENMRKALATAIVCARNTSGSWYIDHTQSKRNIWQIESVCTELNSVFGHGPSPMLEVDDDQNSNASKGLKDPEKEDERLPLIQKRNDKKTEPIGTTSHVVANRLTNMHLAFTWHWEGESTFDCMKRLFTGLPRLTENASGAYIDCDRQYTTNDFLDWLDDKGFQFGGTKKRRSGHAFTYSQGGRTEVDDETKSRIVPMSGAAHDYWAKTRDKERFHVAFRQATGTDKVCLAITNQEAFMGKWTFSMGRQLNSRLQPLFPDVIEMTYEQSSNPAWFYLRRGIITSSTAVHFLRLAQRFQWDLSLPDVVMTLLSLQQDSLEFEAEGGNRITLQDWVQLETSSERKHSFNRISDDELCQTDFTGYDIALFQVPQLKKIAALKGMRGCSQLNKLPLFDAIVARGSVFVGENLRAALRMKMLKASYMPPLRSDTAAFKQMRMGNSNERRIMENLPGDLKGKLFVKFFPVSVQVKEVDASIVGGLVINRTYKCIGTSIDGANVLTLKVGNGGDGDTVIGGADEFVARLNAQDDMQNFTQKLLVCDEFKTVTTNRTVTKCNEQLRKIRTHCDSNNRATLFMVTYGFPNEHEKDGGNFLFKCIPEAKHRVQLLHHCAVINNGACMYVRATTQRSLYKVLVLFHSSVLTAYQNLMGDLFSRMTPFIHSDDGVPPEPDLRQDLPAYGYAIDADTIATNVMLRRSFYHHRLQQAKPLHNIGKPVPLVAALHNKIKAAVDNTHTRKMNEVAVKNRGSVNMATRFLQYVVSSQMKNIQAMWNWCKLFSSSSINTAEEQMQYVRAHFEQLDDANAAVRPFKSFKSMMKSFNNVSTMESFLEHVIESTVMNDVEANFVGAGAVSNEEVKGNGDRVVELTDEQKGRKLSEFKRLVERHGDKYRKMTRPNRLKVYDTEMKEARLATYASHSIVNLEDADRPRASRSAQNARIRQKCLLCRTRVETKCAFCQVPLCNVGKCWTTWHSRQSVSDAPASPPRKRRRKSGEVGENENNQE